MYRLLRCAFCSLVWTENPPPPSAMEEHYGVQYDNSVTLAGEDERRWSSRCRVVQGLKANGAILDLGCSGGGFLTSLKGPSWRRYGIEMSERAADLARARCGAEIFVGDILGASFPPDSFDVITCFHVLEHLHQPRKVLERVSEWLKPGGIFYIMVPNIDSAAAKIFRSYWYALELPRHVCHFSPISLTRLATAVGLEPVSVTTHREPFLELSTRYIFEELLRRAGFSISPLAQVKQPGIPWRVVRKGFRLTILPVLAGLTSLAGDGESIHAVFAKAATPPGQVIANKLVSRTEC